jgi:hypothetical protein
MTFLTFSDYVLLFGNLRAKMDPFGHKIIQYIYMYIEASEYHTFSNEAGLFPALNHF